LPRFIRADIAQPEADNGSPFSIKIESKTEAQMKSRKLEEPDGFLGAVSSRLSAYARE
jgi:hypothetical protein